jgi:dihydroorotate dehydrogenase electron transfer subunit
MRWLRRLLIPGNVISAGGEYFEIADSLYEAKNVKTLIIKSKKLAQAAKPGQYMVLMRPMLDINPMSFSSIDKENGLVGITFKVVGKSTQKYAKLKKGDKLLVQYAPRGNGFSLSGRKILCVGGGVGVAALVPLIDEAYSKGIEIDCISGFKMHDEIIFQEKLSEKTNLCITTEDGSFGRKGTVLSAFKNYKPDYDYVYCCGPEEMMYKVFQFTEKYGMNAQFSLERYIRCGVGLCGFCCVDGYRVCSDGPIFSSKQLRRMKEFGKYKMDLDGRKIPIEQPYSKFESS